MEFFIHFDFNLTKFTRLNDLDKMEYIRLCSTLQEMSLTYFYINIGMSHIT